MCCLFSAAKYKLYRALTKASSATTDLSSTSQSGQQTRQNSSQAGRNDGIPTASSHRSSSLRSLPKSRPVESPAKSSASNPFSPVKPSRVKRFAPHNSREIIPFDHDNVLDGRLPEAESDPFVVSPSTESTVPVSSIFSANRHHSLRQSSVRGLKSISSPSSFPSTKILPSASSLRREISPTEAKQGDSPTELTSLGSKGIYDSAPSRKLQDLLVASSMDNRTGRVSSQTHTPRTKARKRMRGEDIPYTPSETRGQKRWRGTPVHNSEQITDIPKNPPVPDHHEAQANDNGDIDELPESPVKPRYPPASIGSSSGFKPIFEQGPAGTRVSHTTKSAHGLTPILENADRWTAQSSTHPEFGEQSPADVVMGTVTDVMDTVTDVGPQYVLYPPSPPALKQHPNARSNSKISRSNRALDGPLQKMDEIELSTCSDEDEDVVISHNLAWGARPDWLACEGNFGSDSDDDGLGKTVLPSRYPPQFAEILPTAANDLEVSDNLSQALTISAFGAGHNISREPCEAAASHRFAQGREDLSPPRAGGGIWGIGEFDDDGEVWESEPDGWNASPNS